MPTQIFNVTNNAYSTLASSITSGATSLTLASGEGARFPSSNFPLSIEDEILRCTSRSGDVCTVVRGQEGTTAAGHNASVAVNLYCTAKTLNQCQGGRAFVRVIAANDSDAAAKAQADYPCDFVNDEVEFQTAIDELEALGEGTLIVCPGTYHFDDDIYIEGRSEEHTSELQSR